MTLVTTVAAVGARSGSGADVSTVSDTGASDKACSMRAMAS
ncbi:MAG TPA: hypothetical protein VJ793_08000 [Anaerolineae bacterium]|nr:hypothetical protein [Anaerolineae bacterium]